MFGIYRTILASLVVLQHFAGIRNVGSLSVTAFFCLSGFLMTLLVTGPYRGRIGDFAINRFLRLFPAYWATMAFVTTLFLLGVPGVRKAMGLPHSWEDWLLDIFYVNFAGERPVLIPTGWAVTNEIVMYALIAFGISRNRVFSIIWLAVSFVYFVWAVKFSPGGAYYTHFSVMAASLPFALGAVLFHFRDVIVSPRWLTLVGGIVAALCLYLLGRGWIPYKEVFDGYLTYWNLRILFIISNAVLILGLYQIAKQAPSSLRRFDDLVGRVSYPMYLNHYGAAMCAALIMSSEKGAQFGIAVWVISLILSILTAWLVDAPVERLRTRVREGKLSQAPSSSVAVKAA